MMEDDGDEFWIFGRFWKNLLSNFITAHFLAAFLPEYDSNNRNKVAKSLLTRVSILGCQPNPDAKVPVSSGKYGASFVVDS